MTELAVTQTIGSLLFFAALMTAVFYGGVKWTLGVLFVGLLARLSIDLKGFDHSDKVELLDELGVSAVPGEDARFSLPGWIPSAPRGLGEFLALLLGQLRRYRVSRALKGRYRIRHTLGEGGLTTVYLATHGENQSVLKVLDPKLATRIDRDALLRAIAASAAPENTAKRSPFPPPSDWGMAGPFLFYVMPVGWTATHIEGEPTAGDQLGDAVRDLAGLYAGFLRQLVVASGPYAILVIPFMLIGLALVSLKVAVAPFAGLALVPAFLATLPFPQALLVVLLGPCLATALLGIGRQIGTASTRRQGWWRHSLGVAFVLGLFGGLIGYEIFAPWCTFGGTLSTPQCRLEDPLPLVEVVSILVFAVLFLVAVDMAQMWRFRSAAAESWSFIRQWTEGGFVGASTYQSGASAFGIMAYWEHSHHRGYLGLLGLDEVEARFATPYLTSEVFAELWTMRRNSFDSEFRSSFEGTMARMKGRTS